MTRCPQRDPLPPPDVIRTGPDVTQAGPDVTMAGPAQQWVPFLPCHTSDTPHAWLSRHAGAGLMGSNPAGRFSTREVAK